jgi:hypothetical protein
MNVAKNVAKSVATCIAMNVAMNAAILACPALRGEHHPVRLFRKMARKRQR